MPEDTVYGDQKGEKQRMIKDIIIAILAGIAIAQRITPPWHPARAAVALIIAVMVFMILQALENVWDKRVQISCQVRSRIRWWRICLRTYPAELAQRRRRRQMMRDYIQRLRSLPPEERGRNLEESEA